jgi:hypothetical protein
MASLQLRRGLSTNRTSITPAEGELIYTTDTKKLYAGDGSTAGGNQVGGQSDGTVTSVAVSGGSTGLTTSGGPVTSSGTITLGGTLGVANGGTGATDAGGARTNLSAAASGANSDITSLSGLTTALSIAQGGTGATTASNAINALVPSQTTNEGKFLSTNGTVVSWASVDAFPSQTGNAGEVLTTNGTTTSWNSLGVTRVIYVTTGGNDTTADGSITKPFLTIGAAMTYINATFPVTLNSGDNVVIMLAPGLYPENVTINRFLTHIWGYEGKSKTTRISGTVTIQGANDYSGIFGNSVTLNNLFVSASSTNSAVVLTGTIATNLEINNSVLYTEGTGSPLLINNTAAAGNRLRIPYCEIQATGNAPALDITNVVNCAISNINSNSASTSDAWKFTNSSGTIGVLQLTTSTATNVLTIAGTSTINIGYSAFTSTKANGNGVSVSSTSTFIAAGCVFNIPTGTGYTVYGPAGSVYIRGGNYSVFGTNSTTGPTLTALNMPGTAAASDITGTLAVANGGTGTTTSTGTGSTVRATSPTLVTPTLGVATATSVNKVAFTAPATSATLTLADGSTLATSGANSITLTSTEATTVTLPTTGTLATLAGTETLTNKTLTSPTLNGTVAFGAVYTETNTAVISAASTTIDCATSNNFAVDLSTSITTLSFSNVPASGRQYSATLFLTQGGGGSKTINWPGSVKWPSATAPTLTTTNGKVDIIVLTTYDGGTSWFGMVAGQNF